MMDSSNATKRQNSHTAKKFLQHNELPEDKRLSKLVQTFAKKCVVNDGLFVFDCLHCHLILN